MIDGVSVIVPTRGDSPRLRSALTSALGQSSTAEVVIGHDRRGTEPPLVAARFGSALVRVAEADGKGPAAARNAGLATARGRVIAFLDDDDLWLPGHLDAAIECLSRQPEASLVSSDAFFFEDVAPTARGETLPRFRPQRGSGPLTLRDLLLANEVLTPTVVLDRARLPFEPRFDERLRVMEDYDLWLRVAAERTIWFDARPLTLVRRRARSASRDLRRMAEDGLEVLGRALEPAAARRWLTEVEQRRRLGRLWHDLAYACLVEDDPAGARRALRESCARLPLYPKNYIYWLSSALPKPLRSGLFARGRKVLEQDPAPGGWGSESAS
jgi:glycosyltransferase involved in cell wall biosynthesis